MNEGPTPLARRSLRFKAPSEHADTFIEVRHSRRVICGLTLVAALGAAVAVAAPAHSAAVSTKPHALKLLINGKQLNKVVISTTEPSTRTWRTCSTGTSCSVSSWTVRILKKKGRVTTIVGGFMVCLARGTTPS